MKTPGRTCMIGLSIAYAQPLSVQLVGDWWFSIHCITIAAGQVVPTGVVLRFDDEQPIAKLKDDIRFRQREARPEPNTVNASCLHLLPSAVDTLRA